jgi:hypothetical protein
VRLSPLKSRSSPGSLRLTNSLPVVRSLSIMALSMAHVPSVVPSMMRHTFSSNARWQGLLGVCCGNCLAACNWHPANFAQFHHILSTLAGASRRWLWLLFLAQSWALWQVCNKMTIENFFINHPSASINSKTRDKAGICWMFNEFREIYVTSRWNP